MILHIFRCPEYTLKCNYGACVSKSSRCDGRKQCADGSDELNCPTNLGPTANKPSQPIVPKPPTSKPTHTTTSTVKPSTQRTEKYS